MHSERLGKGLLGLIVALYTWVAYRFWFVTDDAFISFRYARNLGRGFGLRYNQFEDPPVEGYSNFLWVLIASVFEAVKLRSFEVMPAISLVCGMALLLLVYRSARKDFDASPLGAALVVGGLACMQPMIIWATGGLATMPFALLFFVAFRRMVLRDAPEGEGVDRWAVLAMVLLGLIRTEGVAWSVVIFALALVGDLRTPLRRPGATFRAALLWVVGVQLVYGLWRLVHFGSLVSNTAKAKAGIHAEGLERGFDYVLVQFLEWPVMALWWLGVAVLALTHGRKGLLTAALAFGPWLYAVLMGGDFMTSGRLIVISLPLLAMGMWGLLQRLPAPVALLVAVGMGAGAALPTAGVQVVPEAVREAHRFRFNNPTYLTEIEQWRFMDENTESWTRMGRILRIHGTPEDSVVVGAIGAVGYFSRMTVYDRFGLVSPEVLETRLPQGSRRMSPGHDHVVEPSFFLVHEPTYLDIVPLQPGVPPRLAEMKMWMRNSAPSLRRMYEFDVLAMPGDRKGMRVAVIRRKQAD